MSSLQRVQIHPLRSAYDHDLERFKQLCSDHPELVKESLLVFKTWLRIGNKHPIPYKESTLEECLEWLDHKLSR